jgi:hypothetical protein
MNQKLSIHSQNKIQLRGWLGLGKNNQVFDSSLPYLLKTVRSIDTLFDATNPQASPERAK